MAVDIALSVCSGGPYVALDWGCVCVCSRSKVLGIGLIQWDTSLAGSSQACSGLALPNFFWLDLAVACLAWPGLLRSRLDSHFNTISKLRKV